MQPIHELLARIRHDREFGKARFEIGYFDRRENVINWVAFHEIVFPDDRRGLFEVLGEAGERRQIPFHRVREVYRNGQLIWERPKARENQARISGHVDLYGVASMKWCRRMRLTV